MKSADGIRVATSNATTNQFGGMAKLEEQIRSCVGKNKSCVIVGVEINARAAAEMLDEGTGWNAGNRRLDEINVQKFKRIMDAKGFRSDSVIILGFFDDGSVKIGDCQHRLQAQVRLGCTQTYIVKVYTQWADFSDAVVKVDAGRPRSSADLVQILGIHDKAQLFERVVNAMQQFNGVRASTSNKPEWLAFAACYKRALSYALALPARDFKAHLLGAIVFAHHREPRATEGLIADVVRKAGLSEGSPAHVLVQSLADMNAQRTIDGKNKAIVRLLRIANDARNERKRSPASRIRSHSPETYEAISYFVNKEVANLRAGASK